MLIRKRISTILYEETAGTPHPPEDVRWLSLLRRKRLRALVRSKVLHAVSIPRPQELSFSVFGKGQKTDEKEAFDK